MSVAVLFALPGLLSAEDLSGVQPLISVPLSDIPSRLSPDTQVLIEASEIEKFLRVVDGTAPDWQTVYGRGHHDSEHDERLFRLNRERDAKRAGTDALLKRIAFVWSGELSSFDRECGGFRVALGPTFTPTGWGLVRFKYEDLPGNLCAVPATDQRTWISDMIRQAGSIEIRVLMAGTLIPDESIVYDFSHDQEALGLIMPVVRVDTLLYLLLPS